VWLDTDATSTTVFEQCWRKAVVSAGTSITGADDYALTLAYTVGFEQVYLNGVLLVRAVDYTATDGSTVTLTTATTVGDYVEIITTSTFTAANTYTQSAANAAFYQVATTPMAGKNFFINGAMQIWQRGTSFNATTGTTTAYSADRWTWWGGNSATLATRQSVGDTTNLPNIQYCARISRPAGNTGTSATYFGQAIETINSIPLAGKTVTVSYYARAGANMSNNATLQPVLVSGTGTDQNYIHSAWTGFSLAATGTVNLTTTWTRYSFTGTVPTNCTELTFQSYWIPSGTAGAADYYEITGIQLEVGSVATAFQTASGSVGGELALCQRYFNRAVNGSVNGNYRLAGGNATSTSAAEINYSFPVTMRTSPTLAVSAAGHFFVISSTGGVAGYPTGLSGGILTPTNARVDATGAGGLTAGNATALQAANSSATIDFSAEL
jgi:hypothetical protein